MPLLADVTFSTEGIVIITGLLGALVGALVFIFKLLMQAQKEKFELAMRQSEDQKKSYREIAEEAVAVAEKRVASKLPPMAGIVPEHHSPPTEEQKETAELQTLRARITAVTLAAGLPPRAPGMPEAVKPATWQAVPTLSDVQELRKAVAEAPEKIAEKVVEKIREEKQDMTP